MSEFRSPRANSAKISRSRSDRSPRRSLRLRSRSRREAARSTASANRLESTIRSPAAAARTAHRICSIPPDESTIPEAPDSTPATRNSSSVFLSATRTTGAAHAALIGGTTLRRERGGVCVASTRITSGRFPPQKSMASSSKSGRDRRRMSASALRASQRISLNSGVSFRTTMTPTVPLRPATSHCCLRSAPPLDCGLVGTRILVTRMSYGIPHVGHARWINDCSRRARHCRRTGQRGRDTVSAQAQLPLCASNDGGRLVSEEERHGLDSRMDAQLRQEALYVTTHCRLGDEQLCCYVLCRCAV